MDHYAAIEAKYGFVIPEDYRRMERDGFFDLKNNTTYCWNDETYLWIPEAEWMKPKEILAYEPASFHKPGFIPFAFTGAHDHWCWYPAMDPKAIVHCPHDEFYGRFDAADFLGSIYRRCLDYAVEIDSDEDESREHYSRWVTKLSTYFPPAWIETLRSIGTAPVLKLFHHKLPYQALLTQKQYDEIVARDLAFPRLDEEFAWMTEED